jgi:hypothetical protein
MVVLADGAGTAAHHRAEEQGGKREAEDLERQHLISPKQFLWFGK